MNSINQNDERGELLLQIAREAISQALGVYYDSIKLDDELDWLHQPGATFVTLTKYGELRGCIGSLQACDSLIDDVRGNAISAALYDKRFVPLTADELDSMQVEVSLLSQGVEPIKFVSEVDALMKLRPTIDGVIFEYGAYRSTFLPQVWEKLPEPALFLANLKSKAGLAEDFWDEDIQLSRYTVSKWRETSSERKLVYG
jgi:AmmeMemoRadiSam system protein A